MVHAARLHRRAARISDAVLVRKYGDQPPVTGIEIDVPLRWIIEIRLIKDKGHTQNALPEIDRHLPTGPGERDVVHADNLNFSHRYSPDLGRF